MSTTVNEFIACFCGGVGTNGQIKETWCRVRILANGESEYKYLGKLSFRWHKLIPNLDDETKYPYTVRDLFLGSDKCTPMRVYNFSMKLEPYRSSMEHSSLSIVNKQLRLQLIETTEKLASAQKMLRDLSFDDRKRKEEIDNAKHQKALRSNLMYNEQIGFGV